MIIEKNKVVSIHYELKTSNNSLIEDSRDGDPLTYLQGAENIIPGLEDELLGKKTGDKFEVTLEPEKAYGYREAELIQIVSLDEFDDPKEVKEGIQIEIEVDDEMAYAIVTKVDEKKVTLDANHPLSDLTLKYNVEVMSVRDASSEELSHGHAHGPGGFEHN